MDTKILKSLGAAAALLIGLVTTSPALATSTFAQGLGLAANAIDISFAVFCLGVPRQERLQ